MSLTNKEIMHYLKLSTLCPAKYSPSDGVKSDKHAAVFADGKPFLLTGPADDAESVRQAFALSQSISFRDALIAFNLSGRAESGTVNGRDISWNKTHSSVATSISGEVEDGDSSGALMAILLDESHDGSFATFMCIKTDVAQIIDSNCPVLSS